VNLKNVAAGECYIQLGWSWLLQMNDVYAYSITELISKNANAKPAAVIGTFFAAIACSYTSVAPALLEPVYFAVTYGATLTPPTWLAGACEAMAAALGANHKVYSKPCP